MTRLPMDRPGHDESIRGRVTDRVLVTGYTLVLVAGLAIILGVTLAMLP